MYLDSPCETPPPSVSRFLFIYEPSDESVAIVLETKMIRTEASRAAKTVRLRAEPNKFRLTCKGAGFELIGYR
jgi:hypothetical protein